MAPTPVVLGVRDHFSSWRLSTPNMRILEPAVPGGGAGALGSAAFAGDGASRNVAGAAGESGGGADAGAGEPTVKPGAVCWILDGADGALEGAVAGALGRG
jgi:hypothetical protein